MQKNPFLQQLPAPYEEVECKILAQYLTLLGLKFSHIPNETYTTSRTQKAKNKLMGVNKGVPDYIIFIKKEKCSANEDLLVFIEMKRERGGVVSQEQKDWLANLDKVNGVRAYVCRGFTEAEEVIRKLLNQSVRVNLYNL